MVAFYLGRPRDKTLDGKTLGTWERPCEDPDEGCPGGYQASRLVHSLMRFYRRADDHGGRVANPAFDRCTDELVLEAIACLEIEEQRCEAEFDRARLDALRNAKGAGSGGT